MRFAQPAFIYLTLGLTLALLVFYFLASKWKKDAKEKLGDLGLVQQLCLSFDPRRACLKRILIMLVVVFLGLTLARPQMGKKEVQVRRKGVDIVVCLDLSLSMLCEDFKPNRLEKAKMELANLMGQVKGDRVGIVVFAGDAYVQCPLTVDLSAALLFLEVADVGLVPKPGTAIGDAIYRGIELFDRKEKKYKVMLLLTDGEDQGSQAITAAGKAKDEGIVIHSVGIGSTEGEPIPLRDKSGNMIGYKKDEDGNMVLSRSSPEILKEISSITQGKYFWATSGEMEMERIYDEISNMEKKELGGKLFTLYQDKYQYFLVVSLLFLIAESFISERRRLQT